MNDKPPEFYHSKTKDRDYRITDSIGFNDYHLTHALRKIRLDHARAVVDRQEPDVKRDRMLAALEAEYVRRHGERLP